MKQIKKLIFLSFLIFLVINLFPQDVILSVDEYAPLIDSSIPGKGFITEIVVLSFEAEGITPVIRFRPWARIQRELSAGLCASFVYIRNIEREENWLFSDEIFGSNTVLVTRKDKNIPVITSLEELKDYKIGISRGYSYGNDFDNYCDQLDILLDNTDFLNIRKILGGWIDIFPCDPYIAEKLISDNFSKEEQGQFKILEGIIFDEYEPFYLVIGKTHPEAELIIQIFNSGLSKITANGKKEEILSSALEK